MKPSSNVALAQAGADSLKELLSRPWECSVLEMELKTAICLKDVTCCRELLKEKGELLMQLKSHEFAELMGEAIHSGAAADELVGVLLQSGVPAQCVYDHIGPAYQRTPLITAARLGRLDLIQKLIAAGAELFWSSPTGANALSEILPSKSRQARRDDTHDLSRVREWLTLQGVRIDPLCADSRRKLCWASSNPVSWPDIPALLELGIPLDATGWTPFMLRLAMGTAIVSEVAGLPEVEIYHSDAMKRTPFLLAVAAGDLEMAKALFERGSNLNVQGHIGATALHLAAQYGHCHLIEWLLEHGLPLDGRNEFGNSALHAAVGANCLEGAKCLLQKGADVHERNANDYGLIHDVSFSDDLAMLKALVKAGANVNDVSGGGSWPLHDACHSGNIAAVSYLIQEGASPNLTSTGETALFAAVSSDSLECVQLLVEAGADVNAADCDGWTCLFRLRSESVAHFLLEHGANPGLSDQCGGLPEDWARVPLNVQRLLRKFRTTSPQATA